MPTVLLMALFFRMQVHAQPDPRFESPYLRVELAASRPAFTALAVDSLGTRKLSVNPVLPGAAGEGGYKLRRKGQVAEYVTGDRVAWSMRFAERSLTLDSAHISEGTPPLVIEFDPHICHATLLGLLNPDGRVKLPALMHLPDLGTLRVTSSAPVTLGYEAVRLTKRDYVRITFPGASETVPKLSYTWDVVAIHPAVKGIEHDRRFDGFRRNFLNIFQLNPRTLTLANHAASDPCALTLFKYADVAVKTPPLANGVTALGLLRQTLERYLGGMKAYGMVGYKATSGSAYIATSLDSYPSLVISAADYVKGSGDHAWLREHYSGIRSWAESMAAYDADGDGVLEYPLSGNAGVLRGPKLIRPSNWWDGIGFGHKDAYSNALAYRAFLEAAEMAKLAGDREGAESNTQKAGRLRANYYGTFFNPKTGVLAGWISADGNVHDYYFTFVNAVAITYGLVAAPEASAIMDRLLAKMREVGYTRFELGLPGNLIPIRRDDYIKHLKRWGCPDLEDGSDGFQIYENGGATACFTYFTLQALYGLNRRADADRILFPLLGAFEAGEFQGRGANGMTKDWKAWDGTPHGYEGLLVDNYLALLAVVTGWAR